MVLFLSALYTTKHNNNQFHLAFITSKTNNYLANKLHRYTPTPPINFFDFWSHTTYVN